MSLALLLVDDDRIDRMAVRRALVGLDADIVEADQVEAAQRELSRREFDCVLLDLRLPGAEGLDLLKELRASGSDVPVIVLTGQGDEQTAVELMKAGASDYLSKSGLSPQGLTQSIRTALRVREVERTARQAQRQLAEAEARYRFLAESIPQMVWVAGSDCTVSYANGRCREYLGIHPGAPLGDVWSPGLHPADRANFQRRWTEAVAAGERFECEMRLLRHADGAYRWHLCRAEPMRSGDGPAAEWFGTSTDIEERKRSEAEHSRLAKEAQESSRAKDLFLATLSHELRTPMNAILGWVSMLRSENLPPERIQKALEVIDRNARAQTQLIEDLLDVSRIVSGKLRIEKQPVDIRAVVDAAIEATRPAADAKRLALAVAVGEELTTIGDGARLQQVVLNLLTNAVKFTPEGGRIGVRAHRIENELRLEVADSGVGIDSEFLPYVFDRFRQAEEHSARSHGGLGLGLSIVKHLAEMHGGRVHVQSEGRGRGTTFVVALPARASAPARTVRSDNPPAASSLAGIDVLVIDDDEDAREMMSLALGEHGANVRVAASASEARASIDNGPPAVIVSDIGMPNEDGYALIAELRRRSSSGPHIPAIALTGYAGLDDQRRAREAGFDRHISKPVDLVRLVAAVASLSRSGRSAAAATS